MHAALDGAVVLLNLDFFGCESDNSEEVNGECTDIKSGNIIMQHTKPVSLMCFEFDVHLWLFLVTGVFESVCVACF